MKEYLQLSLFCVLLSRPASRKKRGAQEWRNFRLKNCASKKSAVVELLWLAKISEP